MTTSLSHKTLYDQDFCLWIDKTVKQLQWLAETQDIGSVNQIDWENLIEEIESLGNEQRRKVDSYLRQLLIHLLMYRYWQPERAYCARGWKDEIGNFRYELELLFKSKTLYNYFLEEIETVYPKARKQVIQKTELSPQTFPEQCPFSAEEILDPDYLPE